MVEREVASHRRTAITAFFVIFLAEWGDLTQILTANLAAHYHDALSVGIGALLALWTVAGLAVVGGQSLLRRGEHRHRAHRHGHRADGVGGLGDLGGGPLRAALGRCRTQAECRSGVGTAASGRLGGRRCREAIADAANGGDPPWILRVRLDLEPDATDVLGDR